MNEPPADPNDASDRLRVKALGPPQDVPVFNCIVNVSRNAADGLVTARMANLAGLEASGKSEREALAQLIAAVKTYLAARQTDRQPIPWLTTPVSPKTGEVQRFIALHL
jgi:hypothetical protein